MQRGEDRDAEPGDEFEHLDLVADVEVVGRLVEDQMIRALGEARAISTRCFSPPESVLKLRSARSSQPTRSMA